MSFLPSTIPPPEEDSEDLMDEEVEHSIETDSEADLAKKIAAELSPGHASIGKGDARYSLHKQELKRKQGHIYCRTSLCCPDEPDKVLVYRIDWLTRGQTHEQR